MQGIAIRGLGLKSCVASMMLLLMAACGKTEEPEPTAAQQQGTPAVAQALAAGRNELVVNDSVYPLNSSASMAPNERYTVFGRCPEGEVLYFFTAEAMPYSMGKTFDLTDTMSDGGYDFTLSGERVTNFSLCNVGGYFYGTLQHVVHDGSTVFSSGTLLVTKSPAALEYKVDGVLVDGTTVSLYVYVPADEIDDNGYCGLDEK